MKTLCIMDSVSQANGGIFEAERRMQQTLQCQTGVEVQVVGLRDSHTESNRLKWRPLNPIALTIRGPQVLGFAPGLVDTLLRANADLAYCAGLWRYPSLAALRWTQRTGKPLVVAPHGMLEAWALRNSRFKKLIAGWLYQNRQFQRAACIRALCEAEVNSIRAYGLKNPIAIIPNGIDLPDSGNPKADSGNPPWHGHVAPGQKVLLFLSRLHPKKGLVNLLKVWAALQKSEVGGQKLEWVLAIAGWEQNGHEAELKSLASELRLAWTDARCQTPDTEGPRSAVSGPPSVLFLGPQFNKGKTACYAHCDGFILPSLSEGVPMAVLEAWAYGKPVLMSSECNLPIGFARGAALRIDPNLESMTQGLREFFQASDTQRQTLGDNGLRLAREQFAWPVLGREMAGLYEWLLGGGSKPGCVV